MYWVLKYILEKYLTPIYASTIFSNIFVVIKQWNFFKTFEAKFFYIVAGSLSSDKTDSYIFNLDFP